MTATIQIPSWLPSWPALYQRHPLVGTGVVSESKAEYQFYSRLNFRFPTALNCNNNAAYREFNTSLLRRNTYTRIASTSSGVSHFFNEGMPRPE